MADGGGVVGDSRKRDSGHYFDSGLVGEKESEEGDAFKRSGPTPRENQVGEDPHPRAKLRRWLAATAEQQDGDRGAAEWLRFTRQKAAAAVLAGPRARGGNFIGRP
jgi:hypothetical protein